MTKWANSVVYFSPLSILICMGLLVYKQDANASGKAVRSTLTTNETCEYWNVWNGFLALKLSIFQWSWFRKKHFLTNMQ